MFRKAAAAEEGQSTATLAGGAQEPGNGGRLDDLAVDASLSWPLHVQENGDGAAAQSSRDAAGQGEGVRWSVFTSALMSLCAGSTS